jgi:hypothetical protein
MMIFVESKPVGQETPMSEFTARANIKRFESLLLTSRDKAKRATLHHLLKEERQVLAEILSHPHDAAD